MHYAAKNNATASLKALLNLGAHINARDYKMRTPLFVAAETGNLCTVFIPSTLSHFALFCQYTQVQLVTVISFISPFCIA